MEHIVECEWVWYKIEDSRPFYKELKWEELIQALADGMQNGTVKQL